MVTYGFKRLPASGEEIDPADLEIISAAGTEIPLTLRTTYSDNTLYSFTCSEYTGTQMNLLKTYYADGSIYYNVFPLMFRCKIASITVAAEYDEDIVQIKCYLRNIAKSGNYLLLATERLNRTQSPLSNVELGNATFPAHYVDVYNGFALYLELIKLGYHYTPVTVTAQGLTIDGLFSSPMFE